MTAPKRLESYGEPADATRCSAETEPLSEPLPLHHLRVPSPATVPFAIGTFDTIGPLARATFPHRHTFYELVYVTEGSGSHVIDLVESPLRPPQLAVILPGQVHHWERIANLRGWVILFTEDFLLEHPDDHDTLRMLGGQPCPQLEEDETAGLGSLIAEMCAEYEAASAGFVSVLRAQLHVLLVRAGRLPCVSTTKATSRPAVVTQEFTRLLGQALRSRPPVGGYAERLGISVAYLNEAVKQVTGLTPGQHIRQAHILEAKRLLSGTDLAVRQIAREVGFGDPAYFSHFFRRETGMTPGGFRRDDRGEQHVPGGAR